MKSIRPFILLFLLSFGLTAGILWTLSSGGKVEDHVRVEIVQGQSVQEIAEELQAQDLLWSSLAFRLYLRWQGLDTGIRPGVYLLRGGMSFQEMGKSLTQGEGKEVTVTIPEGYTIRQIDMLLSDLDLIHRGDVLACAESTCDFSSFDFLPSPDPQRKGGRLEGYLFPDTYFVDPGNFVPKFFLERMLGTFREKVIQGLETDFAVSGRSLDEVIIMASIVERETKTEEERPIVAGILWKRFDASRGLDADATVRYALGKIIDPLTREDLEEDSPYNTRRFAGLPPGSIANPGLASIRATLHPEDSPYWYYLHDEKGQIHYSETNEEHNESKAKYL